MAQLMESDLMVATRPAAAGETVYSPCRDSYKRPFDLTILFLSFVFAFPLWALIWTLIPLVIRLTDEGPVFYVQERMGKNGRRFNLIKFRTMVVNAERETGPVWAGEEDDRVTPIGRFLRRTHLDEVPQVVNILRGEMSLVGPRPERPELFEQFCDEIPEFHLRLRVKPGIAGLAQVKGLYHTTPRNKLRYDNIYIDTFNPWMDFKLFVCSIWLAFLRRGC